MKGDFMKLIDLLVLLKKSSYDVYVDLFLDGEKKCITYYGYACDLLEKIKVCYMFNAVVVDYKKSSHIHIVCVL